MTLNDSSADGKTHSRPFIGRTSSVEPLKGFEDPVKVALIESHAVVLYPDFMEPAAAGFDGIDPHNRSFPPPILERIADKILEQLAHLSGISLNGREFAKFNPCMCLLDEDSQIRHGLLNRTLQIDVPKRLYVCCKA